MGVGLGLSKSKSKSTQDTTGSYNKTMAPTNPEWVTQGIQGAVGGLAGLQGQDPRSFVAGPSGLQNQQFGYAGALGGQGMDWLGQAAQMAGNASYAPGLGQAQNLDPSAHANAATAYGGISNYMNPYDDQVVQNGLRDNERSRQMAEMNTAAAAQAAHAFGGSRHGVADAETNSAYDRNAQSFIGNLRQGGFNTALQYANADADRAQGTNLFNASADNDRAMAQAQLGQQMTLANQAAVNGAGQFNAGQRLAGASLLGGLGQYGLGNLASSGATQQGLMQALAGAPLAVQQQIASMFGTLPLGLFQGGTESGNETSHTKGTGSSLGVSASASYGK